MRRLAAVLAIAAACAAVLAVVTGGAPKPASPLDDALGYFREDAPLVAAVETDANGPQAKALAGLAGVNVPIAATLVDRITGGLQLREVDFDKELRPLIGQPLVIGVEPSVGRRRGLAKALVVATRIRNPNRAQQLLLRQPSLLPRSKAHGRRIFESRTGGTFAAAVDGDVFVAGASRAAVAEALGNRRSPDRMRASGFAHELAGLPKGAWMRISADPRALIADVPSLRAALGVKWLSALRRAAATVKAGADGLALDFRLRTDSSLLSDSDLPLSPRPGPLPLIGLPAELAVGVRGPARLVRFAGEVARALAPQGAARLAVVERELRARGLDLGRDLAGRLGNAATVAVDPFTRSWAARVALKQPAAFKVSLQEVAGSLPDLAAALGIPGVGLATPDQGANFYALAQPNGNIVVFGVVGSSLVAASRPHRAAGLASEPTRAAPGAHGSLVASVDARRLALRLIAPRLSGIAALGAPLALGSLGEATASVSIDRDGVRGSAKLSVR